MDLENFPTSEAGQRLLSRVSSDFYFKSYVGKWLYEVMGEELDDLMATVEDMPYQEFVETATWGLKYWEIMYGLDVREDMSYEWRRARIYAQKYTLKPPTPYWMEKMIEDVGGRKAHVTDWFEDHSIAVNTFVVKIEDGSNPVDIHKIVEKLKQNKQSHTVFDVRFVTRIGVIVTPTSEIWKWQAPRTGTKPGISTGVRFNDPLVEITVTEQKYHNRYRFPNTSGPCGTHPYPSRILKITEPGVEVTAEDESYYRDVPYSGNSGNSGNYPIESWTLGVADTEVEVDPEGKGYRRSPDFAGTKPGRSRGLSFEDLEVDAIPEEEAYAYEADLTGTKPGISRAVVSAKPDVELDPEDVKYSRTDPSAGTSGRAGGYPSTSRKTERREQEVEADIESDIYEREAPTSGNSGSTGAYPDESTVVSHDDKDLSTEIKTEVYRTVSKVSGSVSTL